MASLGSLVATVAANTKPFQQGMKKAKGSLGGLQQSTSKFSVGGMIAKLGLAAAAFMAIRATIGAVKDKLGELDAVGKTADKLGVGVQKLMALRFAAGKAGMEAGQFDKALEKMARGVSEAANGMGTAKIALDDLGISAADLAKQSPDKQMSILADSIAKIQNPAEKARVAYQIFGREGVNMLNMLQGGSAAITDQEKRFESLFGKMSRADIGKIEEANDAWLDVKTDIGGAWSQFTVAIAPVLTAMSKFIVLVVQAIGKLMKFSGISAILSGLNKLFGGGTKKVKEQNQNLGQTTELLDNQLEKEKAILAEKQKQADEIKRQGEAIRQEFMNPQEKLNARMGDLNRLVEAGAISWQTYNRAVSGAVKSMKDANKKTSNLSKRQAVGAVTRGSVAAFSAVQSARRDADHHRKLMAEQLAEQAETNRILNSIDLKTAPVIVGAVSI